MPDDIPLSRHRGVVRRYLHFLLTRFSSDSIHYVSLNIRRANKGDVQNVRETKHYTYRLDEHVVLAVEQYDLVVLVERLDVVLGG